VLVFKDSAGKITVKVTDFGYSTLATSEDETVFLPKSRPWNAPEHHFGEFKVVEAKKTDVYSFGMLCLWVLLGSMPIQRSSTEYMFDTSTGPFTSLENLKYDDKVEHLANQLMELVPLAGLNLENRILLKEIFSWTVQRRPERRTSDLKRVVGLLRNER
jgi:serine/threonine protein kinase